MFRLLFLFFFSLAPLLLKAKFILITYDLCEFISLLDTETNKIEDIHLGCQAYDRYCQMNDHLFMSTEKGVSIVSLKEKKVIGTIPLDGFEPCYLIPLDQFLVVVYMPSSPELSQGLLIFDPTSEKKEVFRSLFLKNVVSVHFDTEFIYLGACEAKKSKGDVYVLDKKKLIDDVVKQRHNKIDFAWNFLDRDKSLCFLSAKIPDTPRPAFLVKKDTMLLIANQTLGQFLVCGSQTFNMEKNRMRAVSRHDAQLMFLDTKTVESKKTYTFPGPISCVFCSDKYLFVTYRKKRKDVKRLRHQNIWDSYISRAPFTDLDKKQIPMTNAKLSFLPEAICLSDSFLCLGGSSEIQHEMGSGGTDSSSKNSGNFAVIDFFQGMKAVEYKTDFPAINPKLYGSTRSVCIANILEARYCLVANYERQSITFHCLRPSLLSGILFEVDVKGAPILITELEPIQSDKTCVLQ